MYTQDYICLTCMDTLPQAMTSLPPLFTKEYSKTCSVVLIPLARHLLALNFPPYYISMKYLNINL